MLTQVIKEALISLNRNRTRSTLTLFGMAWGVACFVILVAWGDGFAHALTLGMNYFGDNVTIVWNGQTALQAGGQKAGRRIRMELRDVEDIRKNANMIKRVSPEFYREFPLQSKRRLTTNGVRGINHLYGEMRGQFIEEGRLLSPEDIQYSRRVTVLGQGLRKKLFSEAPALGEEVRIAGIPFTVVGVLKKKVSMSNYFGMDDENLFIPYTAMGSFSQIRFLSVMVIQPVAGILEDQAISQVRQILAKNHHFHPDDDKALLFNTWAQMATIMGGIITGMQIFLAVMGAVTLSIGGIGLMNVMLVSVTERTREIGIRKALGARRRHILLQFLAEALVIALMGGVLGYVFAQATAGYIGVIPFWGTIMGDTSGQADIHLIVSISAFLTAMVVLSIVALCSGFFPAWRASRLSPDLALRYE
jgi:putative ABC transport system permease protein